MGSGISDETTGLWVKTRWASTYRRGFTVAQYTSIQLFMQSLAPTEGLPFRGRRRPVRVDRHGHVALERLSGEAVSIVVKERVDAAGIDLTGFFRPQTPCRLRYERRPGGGLDAKNQESDRARQRRHARPIRPRWRAVRRQCGGGVIVISMSSSQNVRIAFSDDLIWV
jgi:hypothetical protein